LRTTISTITASAIAATTTAIFARGKRGLGYSFWRFAGFAAFGWKNIALINPNFDANNTKGRVCFGQTIVDIGTKSLERNLAFNLFFRTSDFSTTQTSTANDLDALSVCTHGLLHGLFHSTAE
jgi:hypothetical protein